MTKVLRECGLEPLYEAPCIFIGTGIILGLYVDDLIVFSKGNQQGMQLLEQLRQRFSLTVDTEPSIFLGIEIAYNVSERTCRLSQRAYMLKVLDLFNMTNANPTRLPGGHRQELPRAEPGATVDGYPELVGSILYMLNTKPEVAYAAKEAARHMQYQDQRHWRAAKRILRYVKGSIDEALVLKGLDSPADLILQAYVDAAHATNPDTKRSTTGLIISLGPTPFYWRSFSQSAVAASSTEAELVGIRDALLEVRYLRRVLEQLHLSQVQPTVIFTDSQGGIDNVANEIWQGRTRYLDIYARQAGEIIKQGAAVLLHCPGRYMPADLLTKFLDTKLVTAFSTAIRTSSLGTPADVASIVNKFCSSP